MLLGTALLSLVLQRQTFQTRVDLVAVDVTVVDKTGNIPVVPCAIRVRFIQ